VTDPATHLEFEKTGVVRGRTPEGKMTVQVCGLDRPSLTKDRHEHFQYTEKLLDDLMRPGVSPDDRQRTVRKVVGQGQWDHEYAAMWRDLVRERKLDWAALEEEARYPQRREPSA